MWKKRSDIQGISSSSIVGLKAEVSKLQLLSKMQKDSNKNSNQYTKGTKHQQGKLKEKSNKGIEERKKRDLIAHNSEKGKGKYENEEPDWNLVSKKVTEKSHLYEKLKERDYLYGDPDYENEPYLVDFEMKKLKTENEEEPYHHQQNNSKSVHVFQATEMIEKKDLENSLNENDENEKKNKTEELEKKEQTIKLALEMSSQTETGRLRHQQNKSRKKKERAERLEKIKNDNL